MLLAGGLAEEHHWVPNPGCISLHVRKEEDLKLVRWLMPVSHLQYSLKTAADPSKLLELESEQLHLNPRFKSLLELFVSKTTNHDSAEPFSV